MDGPRLGARPEPGGWTRFTVWAPDRRRVELVVEGADGVPGTHLLERGPEGYFEGWAKAPAGTRYRFRLDGADTFNDPCSRFQPDGPHGPSMVVDPSAFPWTDAGFPGAPGDPVIYEIHVGTFTPEGTFAAARQKLLHLAALGVNVIELMPVASFPGRFNWGYDGTHLFAPCAVYGTPDDLRRLVDEAHGHGIAVILDVVYNHLGPDGNYLWQYARSYFSDRYGGEWGDPLNFDGPLCAHVRHFVAENVRHWIEEYHLDGLRLDATQSLFDTSPRHVVSELTEAARAAAPHKRLLMLAENEPQDRRVLLPAAQGGFGCDRMWIDDFHHAARVALTSLREAYMQDYRGTAQELLSCARHNALYQGQHYVWQRKPRGTPLLDLPPWRFVFFLQNHDQIANFLRGDRLHRWGEGRMRAMTVFWLSLPQTPLLFMGQEFFASTPFEYFVDHEPKLQAAIARGRTAFVAQFRSARHAFFEEGYQEEIGEPAFLASKLDWVDAARNAGALALHRELLRLRRDDGVLARSAPPIRLDGAVLGEQALCLRYLGDEQTGDRLVLLNLGPELTFDPCPQPLLAPPAGKIWEPVLSSEEVRFGGYGADFPSGEGTWIIPGQCGLILRSGGSAPPRPTPEEEAQARRQSSPG